MKKALEVTMILILALSLLAGCGGGGGSSTPASGSGNSSGSGSTSGGTSGGSGTTPAPDSGAMPSAGSGSGAPNLVWARNFGGDSEGYFRSVASSGDAYVAAGYTLGGSFGDGDWEDIEGNGDLDAILVKYDANGNLLWKKNFGGYRSDAFNSVIWDGDGYVAVGYSQLFGDGDWEDIEGDGGPIIVKFDADGDVVWKKGLDWRYSDLLNAVIHVSDGYVAVGKSSIIGEDWAGFEGKGYTDAIIMKFDTNGDVVWVNNFGGNQGDEFTSVIQVADGYLAVGCSLPNSFENGDWAGVPGHGEEDGIIVKFDMGGNVVWNKHFGGAGGDFFESVALSDDGYIVVGYAQKGSFETGDWAGIPGNGGFSDAVIVKFDFSGNVLWKKNLGGGSYTELFTVIRDGNDYVATGYAGSIGRGDFDGLEGKGGNDALFFKFGPNGDVVWMQNFGGSTTEVFRSVIRDGDAYIAVGHCTTGSFGNGDWVGVEAKGASDQIIVKFR